MSGITVILGKSLLTEGQVKQTEKGSSKETSVVHRLNDSTLPGAAQDKEQVQSIRFLPQPGGRELTTVHLPHVRTAADKRFICCLISPARNMVMCHRGRN